MITVSDLAGDLSGIGTDSGLSADIHFLSSANLNLPMQSSKYAAHPIPSLQEYQSLWIAWDIVTRGMVPREELLAKPIKLRNALIFYLGHAPAFLGQLSYLNSGDDSVYKMLMLSDRYPFDSGSGRETDRTQRVSNDV